MSIVSDIAKCKRQLSRHAQQHGIHENFGQKEMRQLRDKYDYISLCWSREPDDQAAARALDAFESWCETYTGRYNGQTQAR